MISVINLESQRKLSHCNPGANKILLQRLKLSTNVMIIYKW